LSQAQWFTPSVKELIEHKGFNWKSEDSTNFRFYFEPGTFGETNLEQLKENGEQSRNRVLTLLGEQAYRDRVSVFVLDSHKYGLATVREIWIKGSSAIPQITDKKLFELEKEWYDTIEQADASKVKYYAPRIGNP
jgi:hypothetical protein